jgi:hypothetical protein
VASAAWTVTRRDHEVRIGVTEDASFTREDTEAIADAVEERLDEDGVTTIRFDGSVLEASNLLSRFTVTIRRLADLAELRGLRFHVGPI